MAKDSRFILIDSKDRDIKRFRQASSFEFKFKNSLTEQLTIKKIILKNTEKESDSSDNLEDIPYLILDLSLGMNEGSNKFLNRTAVILSDYSLQGDYRYYSFDKNIKLDREVSNLKLTIRKPNGEIYNLGSINNESIYTIFFIEMEGF